MRWTSTRTGDEQDAGILAFERSYDGEAALVVINVSDDHESHTGYQGATMPVGFAPGTVLKEVFPEGSTRTFTVASDGTVDIDVGAREGVVLVAS